MRKNFSTLQIRSRGNPPSSGRVDSGLVSEIRSMADLFFGVLNGCLD